jgi:hypothetical protein
MPFLRLAGTVSVPKGAALLTGTYCHPMAEKSCPQIINRSINFFGVMIVKTGLFATLKAGD